MAWFGQAGSQTSQLTQSSLIRSDMPGRYGVAEGSATLQPSRLLGFNEDVLRAGSLDRGLHARTVLGLADEQHLRTLQRVRFGAGEGRQNQVGHLGAVRRTEGQHVARQHGARDHRGDVLGLAVEHAAAVALHLGAVRGQVVREHAVGDTFHVLPDDLLQVGLPFLVVGGLGHAEDGDGLDLLGRFGLLGTLAGTEAEGDGEQEQGDVVAGHVWPLCLSGRKENQRLACRTMPGVTRAQRAVRAAATSGCTKLETSPPRRAISRTSVEDRKLCCSAGVRNSVSQFGIRCRFMLASWNSYSKSDTARRPRSSTPAPTSCTKCASSEWKPSTRTFGMSAMDTRARRTRSSSGSAGLLPGLSATPTMIVSNSEAARCTRSTWPLVIGSKVPG